VLPSHVRTTVLASFYISLIRVKYLVGTLCFFQGPPHIIPGYLVIRLLEVNKDHVQVLLLLPISLH
jgi:hypothetical protein